MLHKDYTVDRLELIIESLKEKENNEDADAAMILETRWQ